MIRKIKNIVFTISLSFICFLVHSQEINWEDMLKEEVEVENPKEYLAKIRVGVDGLIVEKGIYKGLLLPQVPVEWKWCEEEFLCQCCVKAGLPPDSWLTKGVKIYKFQAIIFEEETPQGEVRRKQLAEK